MQAGPDARRGLLLDLFLAGVAAVDGRSRMRAALTHRDDLAGAWVVAVGKAAVSMALGTLDALGTRVKRALVVAPAGNADPDLERDPRVHFVAGGHPLPTQGSLDAGAAALAMAQDATAGQPVLLLVSGGASSLMESPWPGITLDDLRRLGHWALGSGLPIGAVNALRRRLSRVKDGRLAAAFGHCRVEGYFISDVPGDDPAVVGSGLLAAGPSQALPRELPPWLERLLDHARGAPEVAAKIPVRCVGRLEDALEAIVKRAQGAGWQVVCPAARLEGDAVAAAAEACRRLAAGRDLLLVRGGETTVILPATPGRGGRNQHLALAAAAQIAGRDDLLVLAAGTDGIDGNTEDAGAVVDGGTLERGADAGLDAAGCLARADSGRFLEQSGDLVHTGPTGTNVGDLLLGLCCDISHSRTAGPSM